MCKILLWQSKLASTIFIFAIKITFKKLLKNAFYCTKKTSFVVKVFKLLCFTLSLFFPFLAIADFIGEVD